MTPLVVYLGGPTGSGKSALGVKLATRLCAEIVNADSQQVYRGLDVGTGKPSREELEAVPHHLFDIASASEQVDVARWAALADETIADITTRGRLPIVVGGTGLWMRALYKGLVDAPPRDEGIRARLEEEARAQGWPALHRRLVEVDAESALKVHPTDPVRITRALEVFELTGVPLSELHRRHAQGAPRQRALHLAIDMEPELLEVRQRKRVRAMFEGALLEETRALLSEPAVREKLERVMGYREAIACLEGKLTLEEAVMAVATEHRRYAKRQRTWFRGESWWHWIRSETEAMEQVSAFLSLEGQAR